MIYLIPRFILTVLFPTPVGPITLVSGLAQKLQKFVTNTHTITMSSGPRFSRGSRLELKGHTIVMDEMMSLRPVGFGFHGG